MVEQDNNPSCYVFGGETLLTQCVEILLSKNFEVRGVVSRSIEIEQWAKEIGVPFINLDTDYLEKIKGTEFDYLFSITHLEILPAEILGLAKISNINFHDGPLPQYAGLNTPVWALLNDEKKYGISWHYITPGVDEGDVIIEETFDISSDETALTLNTKCFASALESFPNLVDGLLKSSLKSHQQDYSLRTYYSKHQRPEAACLIEWSKPAAELEALIRGLDFGSYANPVGVAKFLVDGVAYVAKSAIAQSGDSVPGSILRVDEGELEVGTGDGSLVITSIQDLRGREVTIAKIVNDFGLTPGSALQVLGEATKQQVKEIDSQFCVFEDFWSERLDGVELVELPFKTNGPSQKRVDSFQGFDLNLGTDPSGCSGPLVDTLVAAFVLLVSRIGNCESLTYSFSESKLREKTVGAEAIYSASVPCCARISSDSNLLSVLEAVTAELNTVRDRGTWLIDLIYRQPNLRSKFELHEQACIPVGIATENKDFPFIPMPGEVLILVVSEETGSARLVCAQNHIEHHIAEQLCRQLEIVWGSLKDNPQILISELNLLSEQEKQKILFDWNLTESDYPSETCVHELFEQQVENTPNDPAIVFENEALSYKELNGRANRLAAVLQKKGVKTCSLVGVFVERSLDLMVSTLGILKSGGAYVPLDPSFPPDRIKHMIEDAGLSVIVSQQDLASVLPGNGAEIVLVDALDLVSQPLPVANPQVEVCSSDLAYVIYTSGSTGKPKGVQVEHRNVVNFFTGMDAQIPHDPPGTWLAVTSLSFDISVLELFWTLTRGFKVVIYKDRDRDVGDKQGVKISARRRPMDFGLFMWGNDDAPGRAKYRLMLEGAKFFDENGFNSVWTPERHFHAFGGPYPNPAVTGAAIAAVTKNLSIRAGSCVSPLHHPIRIAEDWAVIDNLSNGRAALAFASGWQPNDFVIKPENHKNNKTIMLEQIETVRKLWRGEKVAFENPMGEMVETSTLPRPVQKELPFWVTTAGNPETYKQAGAIGANVLTHLLGQTVEELAAKIKLYREARKEAGFDPEDGKVTVMLHTFVGEDNDIVRELVRQPMKDYLRSSMKLVLNYAWSFPAFKKPKGDNAKLEDVDIGALSEEETETILDFAFERYFENSGLFGTPDTCEEMINRCKQADINEIACLLDYGVDTDAVMESLPFLKKVRDLTNRDPDIEDDFSFAAQVIDQNVTHFQCTPSMARMLSLSNEAREALGNIDHLFIGGETMPSSLAKDLVALKKSTLTNMYGPTETTIWSTTHLISEEMDEVPIGRPIANTRTYILDKYNQPSPIGIPGELYIGGEGVVRGYLNKPELTSERFVPDPFSASDSERIYWTGDLAQYRKDGTIEFLGRVDHQVKIRGYRIEPGEIESILDQHKNIRESVVVLREDTPGDQRLVAYYVPDEESISPSELRAKLRDSLPDYMVPSDFIALESLPLTPNSKIDRIALPSPQEVQASPEKKFVAPESDLEQKVVELWQNILKVEKVGTNDNFFDLGGHSLLIVRLHAEIKTALDQPVSLTDLYRFPTVRTFVEYLTSSGTAETLKKSTDRAQRRREMTKHRRRRA